ncbi:MAG: hypothetical protein ACYCWW_18295 [Deltaproteobacteria bacterium]
MRPFALALLVALAGCGPDEHDSGSPAQSVRWLGVDSRPLAVGSSETLAFEITSGAACCPGGYAVTSSAPSLLAATDLGGQRVAVAALAAGSAELRIVSSGIAIGSLALTAAVPTAFTFADPSRAAAAMPGEPALPQSFALFASGSAEIAADISDANGEMLFSQGLATGQGSGAVDVVKVEPERFLLTALPASGSGGAAGHFAGALLGNPESALTYPVEIAAVPASAAIEQRSSPDGSAIVLAKAFAQDGTELLGLPAWSFAVAGLATVVPLADAAALILFAPGTAPGTVQLSAQNPAGVTAQLALP